uniref:MAU2 chromatid cohesion factor homolog n=1 Tax=Sander lucioperca TaxID=283035 RepID=A0A8C9X507_SANLU
MSIYALSVVVVAETPEPWYLALLGFAEHFRTSMFQYKPPHKCDADTNIWLSYCLLQFLSQQISQFEDEKFEAARILSEFYCQQNLVDSAKPVLRKVIQISQQTPYWHCRLLFTQLHALEKDLISACDLLSRALYILFVFSMCNSVNCILFAFVALQLLLTEQKLSEVHPLLTLCGTIVENWQGNPFHKESLVQLYKHPCLKQLQQCIQTISTLHDDEILPVNPAALFHWLPKEHMCVLVYLVTGMHSMQAGYLEKAHNAGQQSILSTFQVLLLEHIIMCRLVTGHKATALQEVRHLQSQGPYFVLFSSSVRRQHTLWMFVVTNLASVYIWEGNRHQEYHFDFFSSHCLRAAAFYIRGLLSFFQGRYNEAKRFLRETLKMSNAEDLNRLTACSLVLLGHIFFVLGNHRESSNMVVPAMQLASKIPDVSVQLWSSALLKDLNKACRNAMAAHEAAQMHQNFSQQLLQDHILACSLPEHHLVLVSTMSVIKPTV